MRGYDFGSIGGIIAQYMDTDSMDIKRDVLGELQTVYTNIPCHVTYRSSDNADPYSTSTKPIITTLEIHMDVGIDIRNDDYLVVKKVGSGNSILEVYSGRCGEPVVDQARKKVLMTMNADDSTEPEPLPPDNPTWVSVTCVSTEGDILQPEVQYSMEKGSSKTFYPPEMDDHVAVKAYLDDVELSTLEVTIDKAENFLYEIRFVYEALSEVSYLRLLLNGLYTKDDGSLDSGYYLYKRMPFTLLESNSTYKVKMGIDRIVQEDTGAVIQIETGTKVVVFAGYRFMQVTEVVKLDEGGYSFTLVPYEPTEEERGAYLTEWYD